MDQKHEIPSRIFMEGVVYTYQQLLAVDADVFS
jgi:hypothetical protein